MKDKLIDILYRDYFKYLDFLKKNNKDYIIKHSNEIVIKGKIIEYFENYKIKKHYINKLLKINNPLDEIYKYYLYSDPYRIDGLIELIEDYIESLRGEI